MAKMDGTETSGTFSDYVRAFSDSIVPSQVEPIKCGLVQAANDLLGAVGAFPDAQSIEYQAYIKLLEQHDWSHSFSDDYSRVTRGERQLAALRTAQRALDPQFVVWNRFAPEQCRDGRSYS